ncbi:MAG: hypothetical protein AB7I38_10915 [Dehalococcoidia bacterium]
MPVDIFEIATLVIAGAILLDRGLERMSRLGRWPGRLRRLDIDRAERLVEAREREARLDELAAKSEAILAQLQPNGGSSMRDEVQAINAEVTQQRQILERHIEYAQATDAATSARLDLLAREVQRIDARAEVDRLDRIAQATQAAGTTGEDR